MKPTGGPAFPNKLQFDSRGHCANSCADISGGMTLRDYFAAAALQGMLANSEGGEWPDGVVTVQEIVEHISSMSYRYADALLKVRSE